MGGNFILTRTDYEFLAKSVKRWQKTKSIREANDIVEYLAKYIFDEDSGEEE